MPPSLPGRDGYSWIRIKPKPRRLLREVVFAMAIIALVIAGIAAFLWR